MDRLDALNLFVHIVDLGSFTKAAGVLNLPRATATHTIKALEDRLGVRLLERTTRHVQATPDGQSYYERCRQILADVEDAESSFDGASLNPRGILRLGLHSNHATRIILPRLAEFHARYPNLHITISSGDRLVDLVGEGVDCVVRVGSPKDSSLVGKKLASLKEVICASPDYLSRFGTPSKPEDLIHHQAITFFTRQHNIEYPLSVLIDGQKQAYKVSGWLSVDTSEAYTQGALRGLGLIQVPYIGVSQYLQTGELVEVLAEWASPELPVYVLYPQHHQLSPRIKAFVAWVSEVYQDYFMASTLYKDTRTA